MSSSKIKAKLIKYNHYIIFIGALFLITGMFITTNNFLGYIQNVPCEEWTVASIPLSPRTSDINVHLQCVWGINISEELYIFFDLASAFLIYSSAVLIITGLYYAKMASKNKQLNLK